jgi:hypothetical protein
MCDMPGLGLSVPVGTVVFALNACRRFKSRLRGYRRQSFEKGLDCNVSGREVDGVLNPHAVPQQEKRTLVELHRRAALPKEWYFGRL